MSSIANFTDEVVGNLELIALILQAVPEAAHQDTRIDIEIVTLRLLVQELCLLPVTLPRFLQSLAARHLALIVVGQENLSLLNSRRVETINIRMQFFKRCALGLSHVTLLDHRAAGQVPSIKLRIVAPLTDFVPGSVRLVTCK